MSFTGQTQAAPTNVVDDAPAGSFTVKTPPTALFSTDFSPDNASQVVADEGTSLTNLVGTIGSQNGMAYNVNGTANAGATGVVDHSAGIVVYGSVGVAPTAPVGTGAMSVFVGLDGAVQNGLFLAIGVAAWALYPFANGAAGAAIDSYVSAPRAGDDFVLIVNDDGSVSVSVNGIERLTANAGAVNLSRTKWALVWNGNETTGRFAGHPSKNNAFVIESLT